MTETTRTTKDTAIMIKVSNLYPHPDNPRKDLGDLTELVESIKKNGIMQNLTVIPIGNERDPEEQADAGNIALYSDFRVLIGHRQGLRVFRAASSVTSAEATRSASCSRKTCSAMT